MKTSIPPVLVTVALVCFGVLPNAQAVSPPPDGDYPGRNTAQGQNALLSLTTGKENTAIGAQTPYMNVSGNYNTAIGALALYMNVGGSYNTAVGYRALHDTGAERSSPRHSPASLETKQTESAMRIITKRRTIARGRAAQGER
jgi:hypothetical protein